ncbi:hypothetical protein GA0115239_12219, partial [Streptomyces sp. BpilaLS-43]|uniref:hypothetical protein n=1 Tax=Streptomyces sp. BpilaLS-43 TaxID=1839778 RepID=UPI00081B8A5A
PKKIRARKNAVECSPRLRGWSHRGEPAGPVVHVLPAPVGMVLRGCVVGGQEAVLPDMTALRALRESRTDVEALDVTAECLRHLQDAFSEAAVRAHTTMDRYTRRDDTETPHPVRRDDQQALHPQDPGPHRGREAGH